VLVVNVDALRLVDLLHLAYEVELGVRRALARLGVQLQQLGRVARALVQWVAGLDRLALLDQQAGPAGERILAWLERLALFICAVGDDGHLRAALSLLDVDEA